MLCAQCPSTLELWKTVLSWPCHDLLAGWFPVRHNDHNVSTEPILVDRH